MTDTRSAHDSATLNPEAIAAASLIVAAQSLRLSSLYGHYEDVTESKRRRLVEAMADMCEEFGIGCEAVLRVAAAGEFNTEDDDRTADP